MFSTCYDIPAILDALSSKHLDGIHAVAVVVLAYLGVVQLLRFRRRDGFYRKYGIRNRQSFASMTLDDALEIQQALAQFEFPTVLSNSVFFAVFKTYAIPSISRLLAATGELISDTTVSKRANDTGVIITEVVLNKAASDRRIDGVARMNFLHDRYRKAGKISDDDMLYTLSLFALEPCRWTARLEWRDLTPLERCALGVTWRDVGEAMEIPYDALEPYMPRERDGLAWMEAIEAWSLEYERRHVEFAESNRKVAQATLDVVLFNVPFFLRGFVSKLISALFDPRTRHAMMLPEPGWIHKALFDAVASIRRLLCRYLSPPRPPWLKARWFTDQPEEVTCRYHSLRYVAHPWYIKPTFGARWGFEAMRTRLCGGVLPGDEGARYCPEGYHISELGPEGLRGKGEEEMAQTRTRLRRKWKDNRQ